MRTQDNLFIAQLISSRANVAQVILSIAHTVNQLCKWLDLLVEYYEELSFGLERSELYRAAECVREMLKLKDH